MFGRRVNTAQAWVTPFCRTQKTMHVLAAGSISDRLPGMMAEKGPPDLMRCIRKSFFNLTMEG